MNPRRRGARPPRLKAFITVALALASVFSVGGCWHNPAVIVVGSKSFTEGALLGYIELLMLQHAGLAVEDRIEMGPTLIVREALLSGDIDTYFEYTGTALVNFFHVEDPVLLASPERSYQDVKRLDAANRLTWLEPWALNDTYTVLMSKARAQRLHIHTLSDLAHYSGSWTMGSDPEFAVREDGLPGLLVRYGLHPHVRQMDAGLIYSALKAGLLDAGIGYSTDGRIAAFGLVRLRDNRHYFPAYHPAPVFRNAVLARFPQIASILDPVGKAMTNDAITQLNYDMDVRHERAKTLARSWLMAQGFLEGDQ